MTAVPLPDVPCVRVRLIGDKGSGWEWGNRFYLSYTGTPPTGADCASLASSIESLWHTDLSAIVYAGYTLEEIDVLDIATDSGLSGQWTGSSPGGKSGSPIPVQSCVTVEYGISRRYRGGKPRMYFLAGVDSDLGEVNQWSSAFITACEAAFPAFFGSIEALSVGGMGTLKHVNLSYYKGFTNLTTSSGRERAVPTYRPVALHDDVESYSPKQIISSQRRRRTSTSP
jgi:hypothetical protein